MSQPASSQRKPVVAKRKSYAKKREAQPIAGAVEIVADNRRRSAYRGKEVLRLTDASVDAVVREVIDQAISSPENARAYLVRLGTLTKTGKATRKYGGK